MFLRTTNRSRMGELNTFPLSYKVKGQRIVIVGGGEEALNKARLAVKTTASVVIVAPARDADFSGLGVTVEERDFEDSDLDGAALLFVAEDGPDGQAAIAAFRSTSSMYRRNATSTRPRSSSARR